MLLNKLQISLAEKLSSEHRLSLADNLQRTRTTEKGKDDWYEMALKEHGLIRLPDGRVVKKGGEADE